MAHKVLDWISANCVFPHSAGRLAQKKVGPHLLDFQKKIFTTIFDKDGKVSKNCFIFGARKISKSFIFTCVLWFLLNDVSDQRHGASYPILASTYEQARLLLKQLTDQVTDDKKDKFVIRRDFIQNTETKSIAHVVYNSSQANLGLQSSGMVADELSAQRDRSNLDVVRSGGQLTEGKFLRLYASNPPAPGHWMIPLMRSFEKDKKNWAVFKFAIKQSDDWHNKRKVWSKANPFIKQYYKTNRKEFANVFQHYKEGYREALENKGNEIEFRSKFLGQSISADALQFIDIKKIKIAKDFDWGRKDLVWSCGIDTSISHDMSSVSFCGYKVETDELFTYSNVYLPNLNRRQSTQRKVFQSWHDSGHLVIQDKEVLDWNMLLDDLVSFIKETKIKLTAIQLDPALAGHYQDTLKKNFKVSAERMTGRAMVQSIRQLERIGESGGLYLINEDNPAVKWAFSNVVISQTSRNYLLMNRVSRDNNIDPAVSICLALKYQLDNPRKKYIITSG